MPTQQNLKRLLPREDPRQPTAGSSKDAATQGKVSAFLEAFDESNRATGPTNRNILTPTSPQTRLPTSLKSTLNIPGIWLDDEDHWHSKPGIKNSEFSRLLTAIPMKDLPKVVDDILFNEYNRLSESLTSFQDEFEKFDFDVDQTLEENREALADIGEDFVIILSHMESWQENQEECQRKFMKQEQEWGEMSSELMALEMQANDAQEGAWERAQTQEEDGKYRKEGSERSERSEEESAPSLPQRVLGKEKPKKPVLPKKKEEERFMFGRDMEAPKSEEQLAVEASWERRKKFVRKDLKASSRRYEEGGERM